MGNLNYYFTTYGEVYFGYRYDEQKFPNSIVIIQPDKHQNYNRLTNDEKTSEKINEYGWLLGKNVIAKVINEEDYKPENRQPQMYPGFQSNIEHKTMFVFGAGASANCVYGSDKADFIKDNLRPPLGNGLFQKQYIQYYSQFTGVKRSLTLLQDDSNPDVEKLFEEEWKNIHVENNQAVLCRHISIVYYLQKLFKDISSRIVDQYYAKNLYAKLANKLQKIYSASVKTSYGITSFKNFAFVSFNQDSILEEFISQQFNISFDSIEDYIRVNKSPCYVFKPHGSWNWGWRFPDPTVFNGSTANWLFENNKTLFNIYFNLLGDHKTMIDGCAWGHEYFISKHFKGRFTIDKSQLQIIRDQDLNDFFPAILLPYRDKDEFTMPFQHYNYMKDYIQSAETLILIGWKGSEEAFNKELLKKGQHLKKIVIVDIEPETVKKNLGEILKKPKLKAISYSLGFADFVENGLEKEMES